MGKLPDPDKLSVSHVPRFVGSSIRIGGWLRREFTSTSCATLARRLRERLAKLPHHIDFDDLGRSPPAPTISFESSCRRPRRARRSDPSAFCCKTFGIARRALLAPLTRAVYPSASIPCLSKAYP